MSTTVTSTNRNTSAETWATTTTRASHPLPKPSSKRTPKTRITILWSARKDGLLWRKRGLMQTIITICTLAPIVRTLTLNEFLANLKLSTQQFCPLSLRMMLTMPPLTSSPTTIQIVSIIATMFQFRTMFPRCTINKNTSTKFKQLNNYSSSKSKISHKDTTAVKSSIIMRENDNNNKCFNFNVLINRQ